ncbi:MAG: hypothetical protein DWQ31_17440 [Planctomycetota bacterium]|nr:MAG: hypothetical protein DWQ31_17440 [Planctomycetota bacterium]REJ92136.1 MAG: hypothetical protein DWQ35_13390 [Planctomycetota bacterium]REK28672.1 MAG: hypothetical protein DWQ42_04980 [Planctomycetota bacterium]REK39286.1 MAG: hypothetical protein DWQ46_18560 [Planctomycetota bacterium]
MLHNTAFFMLWPENVDGWLRCGPFLWILEDQREESGTTVHPKGYRGEDRMTRTDTALCSNEAEQRSQ